MSGNHSQEPGLGQQSSNLFFFTLTRLDLQTLAVHLLDVATVSHMIGNPLLKLRDRVQTVRYILVLLDIADHFGRLSPFGEVDELGILDQRRNAILNEGQVSQVGA